MKIKQIYISDENFEALKGINASALINEMLNEHFRDLKNKDPIQREQEIAKMEFEISKAKAIRDEEIRNQEQLLKEKREEEEREEKLRLEAKQREEEEREAKRNELRKKYPQITEYEIAQYFMCLRTGNEDGLKLLKEKLKEKQPTQ